MITSSLNPRVKIGSSIPAEINPPRPAGEKYQAFEVVGAVPELFRTLKSADLIYQLSEVQPYDKETDLSNVNTDNSNGDPIVTGKQIGRAHV